jgi:glycerol kinase
MLMASSVLALDQGTTSSRAILFNRQGEILSLAQHEFAQRFPKAGWVEHDPIDILTSQLTSAVEALARARLTPQDVAAIGITNQRETTLVWDRKSGEPVYNAIVWQDRRTADFCDSLRAQGLEDHVRRKTGLLIDPYFSGTKIAWILDNVSGARKRAERGELAFGTVDSWLVWNLTGGKRHVTDRTNASRTMLYDIADDRWDPELLRALRIPPSMLPEVVWSNDRLGRTSSRVSLGDVELAGIAGDQQAALFGQLCVRSGDAKNTYGTGCFLLQHIGGDFALSKHNLITTIACSTDRRLQYALEGSVFIGGAVVQWLRDKMRFFAAAPDIEALALSAPDAGNLVLVPAFTGLGAPHWDPHASGILIGLQRDTEIGHIARAALESIAFQVADVLYAMQADTGVASNALRADGGAAANGMLMQFQSDLLKLPVERPAILETTALGAAYLAGLAVGVWESIAEIAQHRSPPARFLPHADDGRVQEKYARWKAAVERSKGWTRTMA